MACFQVSHVCLTGGNLLCEIKNRLQHSPDKYGWFDEFDVALSMLKFLWGVFCLFCLVFFFLHYFFTACSPYPCYLSVI